MADRAPDDVLRERELRRQAELVFVAFTTWREARGQTRLVKTGVAWSIVNRARYEPTWWGADVLAVLFKPLQYSSLTDPHDRQLTTWPRSGDAAWSECLEVAEDVLAGRVPDPTIVNGRPSDSYFDDSMKAHPPSWVTPASFVVKLGAINFHHLGPTAFVDL